MISRDDLLVLLEDGPQSPAQLAIWLGTTSGAVVQTLRAMAKSGRVKTVGIQRQWALASYQGGPVDRPPLVADARPPAPKKASEPDAGIYQPLDDAPEDEDALVAEALMPTRLGPGRPKLRQPLPSATTTVRQGRPAAWWVGKSRAELNAEAHAKAPTMSASPEARKLTAAQYPVW